MSDYTRYRPDDLVSFARALFAAVGMDEDKAAVMAELLVEADLFGPEQSVPKL